MGEAGDGGRGRGGARGEQGGMRNKGGRMGEDGGLGQGPSHRIWGKDATLEVRDDGYNEQNGAGQGMELS